MESSTLIPLEEFINKTTPHNNLNGGTPGQGTFRHIWESKQLYSVIGALKDNCSVLDYGCHWGTLKDTLYQHYPKAKYYGLDKKIVIDQITNQTTNSIPTTGLFQDKAPKEDNTYMGYLDEIDDILPKVNCMVLGSVFTHLDWESIIEVLNKTLPYYENGFELGFSAFLGDNYALYGQGHYGDPNTYHVTILRKEQLQDYCKENNLELILKPYVQELDHVVPGGQTYQSFLSIKKPKNQ